MKIGHLGSHIVSNVRKFFSGGRPESFSTRFLCWALLVLIHSKMKLSLCKSFASFNFSSEVWCGKLWFFILVVPSLYMIQVPPDVRPTSTPGPTRDQLVFFTFWSHKTCYKSFAIPIAYTGYDGCPSHHVIPQAKLIFPARSPQKTSTPFLFTISLEFSHFFSHSFSTFLADVSSSSFSPRPETSRRVLP
jgi:hypothetical protein